MSSFKTLDDLGDVRGKAVLVREDLNVPMANGHVTDDTRLRAAMPTLLELADRGAKVLILAHFGRPKGRADEKYSLRQVVPALSAVLGRPVGFVPVGEHPALDDGGIAVVENTRYDPGEEANDPGFVLKLAGLGDIYVNDAFSAAHRAHASTEGLAHVLPAYAGRAMQAELGALEKALGRWTVHPAASAASRICSTVAAKSCSNNDLPTFTPRAARKVLAIPPPMIR